MTANPVVALKTSEGIIKIELYPDKAPVTVQNFLAYVNEGFYNGTIFHRVIPNFMIQGGGFETGLAQKETKDPIINEAGNGLSNTRGTVAMARTNVVDSATAQFFINVADNTFLDHTDDTPRGFGYCVFGKVIEGMDATDKIVSVPRGNFGYHQDVPKEDIVIISATVE
ncbi:cyclophilin EcCYP-like protein [Candidatus Termititenax aidoneus]|uniref:Peptidyl-prolyl cis-trans isomerase n=1 Tax=Termititenax aidoneus TaxID=2218524 RepID=A0A388TCH0_TERA1|nr:cyclophilin EcCYP-like protein [Candidatus Termititenax aidoneus]